MNSHFEVGKEAQTYLKHSWDSNLKYPKHIALTLFGAYIKECRLLRVTFHLDVFTRRDSIKMVFWKVLQKFQENTCARVLFKKINAGWWLATLLEKRLRH